MALSINLRKSEKLVIIDMAGRLWVLEKGLRQQVNELLEQNTRFFVLNFTDLNYIDSSGLGQMVAMWSSIRNRNGQIVLLNPNERIRRLLEITKLDSVFEIYYNEDQAINAVRKIRQASA